MFSQSLGPEKIAEIVSMVTGNQQGFGFLQQTGESDYLNGEEQYGYINPNLFSGYIHPADTLPGVIDPNQEVGFFDKFPGYIHPADTMPGVMNSDQEMGYSFPGYIHPADMLPGVMNSDHKIGYSFPGYIHPADTLPGVMNSDQEIGYSFPGYIHPADTLPGMMETGQDVGYSCEAPGMNSFRSEICPDSLGGFPQIRCTTVTTPEDTSGYVKPRTGKDSLVANSLIFPKPQRQLFKCASPEQFKSLRQRSTMKSTHKQRSKNSNQKLLSINSNVTI
nr:uncharacterized protein LOC109620852 [Crassostrea gigas]